MKTKEYEPEQTRKLRIRCNKNPLEAYFLGGFNLVSKKKQKETRKFLDSLGKANK